MHERGVYAIQDIPVGTRVISEEPLILVKGREINDAELMDAQYHRLPDDKQKWVEGLAPGLFEQFHKLSQMIDRLFPWLEKIDKKPFDERTTQERRNFSYIAPLVLHMLQCWRVASRFTAHCIEFTNLDAEYLPKVAPDVAAKGLFKEATRVRHSCVPNMYHTYVSAGLSGFKNPANSHSLHSGGTQSSMPSPTTRPRISARVRSSRSASSALAHGTSSPRTAKNSFGRALGAKGARAAQHAATVT